MRIPDLHHLLPSRQVAAKTFQQCHSEDALKLPYGISNRIRTLREGRDSLCTANPPPVPRAFGPVSTVLPGRRASKGQRGCVSASRQPLLARLAGRRSLAAPVTDQRLISIGLRQPVVPVSRIRLCGRPDHYLDLLFRFQEESLSFFNFFLLRPASLISRFEPEA